MKLDGVRKGKYVLAPPRPLPTPPLPNLSFSLSCIAPAPHHPHHAAPPTELLPYGLPRKLRATEREFPGLRGEEGKAFEGREREERRGGCRGNCVYNIRQGNQPDPRQPASHGSQANTCLPSPPSADRPASHPASHSAKQANPPQPASRTARQTFNLPATLLSSEAASQPINHSSPDGLRTKDSVERFA